MPWIDRCRSIARKLKRELAVYRRVARHERTPRLAKILLLLAIGYVLMPFDLIPDWIPVLGLLDDVIIVPGLVILALKMAPQDVIDECREVETLGDKHVRGESH